MPYTMMLSWSMPSEFDRISGYNIFVNGTLVGKSRNINFNSTSHELKGLQANTDYKIVIQAINPSGTSGNATLYTRTLKGRLDFISQMIKSEKK